MRGTGRARPCCPTETSTAACMKMENGMDMDFISMSERRRQRVAGGRGVEGGRGGGGVERERVS